MNRTGQGLFERITAFLKYGWGGKETLQISVRLMLMLVIVFSPIRVSCGI